MMLQKLKSRGGPAGLVMKALRRGIDVALVRASQAMYYKHVRHDNQYYTKNVCVCLSMKGSLSRIHTTNIIFLLK